MRLEIEKALPFPAVIPPLSVLFRAFALTPFAYGSRASAVTYAKESSRALRGGGYPRPFADKYSTLDSTPKGHWLPSVSRPGCDGERGLLRC